MKSLFVALFMMSAAVTAFAHCEIPCGIYDDQARFNLMLEHVRTIHKSRDEIVKLSAQKTPDYNQLVRWVTNKDEHANKIKTIVAEYFLSQRIKEADKDYVEELKLLHKITVQAMKTKQSLDEENIDALEKAIKDFQELYQKSRKPAASQ